MGYRVITKKINGKHWYRGFYYTDRCADGKLIFQNPPDIADPVGLAGYLVTVSVDSGKIKLEHDTIAINENDKMKNQKKIRRKAIANALAKLIKETT